MEERISRLLNSFGVGCLPSEAIDYFCESDHEASEDSDTDSDEPTAAATTDEMVSDDPRTTTTAFNQPLIRSPSVNLQSTYDELQLQEKDAVDRFLHTGCGCPKRCHTLFSRDVFLASRLDCAAMDYHDAEHVNHFHIMLMGCLNAQVSDSDEVGKQSKHKASERVHSRFHPSFRGVPVCQKTFLFAFNCSEKVFKRVKKQFTTNGLEPKVHGNVQATSKAKSFDSTTAVRVKTFIENYAEQFGLVLPGRVPAFNNPDLMILPSSTPKAELYRLYETACKESGKPVVSETYFRRIWLTLLPHVVIQKPRTDLCQVCQNNFMSLSHLRTLDDSVKEQMLQKSVDHLTRVKCERSLYQADVQMAKDSLKKHPSKEKLGPNLSNSHAVTSHYSFDYAQQIHLPHNSQQVGPLYFLVPYKVALFGVACEPVGRMVIYAVPEVAVIDKGSNSVISFIHHYFDNYGFGEQTVHLRADNCTGQNKNKYMIAYLCWRIMTGLHTKITLSFLPVGHTKFYPDLGFGLFKRRLRMSTVSTMEELGQCIAAATPHSNTLSAQLVANECGDVFVPSYDWQTKLGHFRAIPQLKKYHHFVFSELGVVHCYVDSSDKVGVSFTLCNSFDSVSDKLPDQLYAGGLPVSRKTYLYEKIRQFCPDYAQDILCPSPETESLQAVEIEQTTESVPTPSHEAAEHIALPSKTRKSPVCSFCHQAGHRNAVRKGKFLCPARRNDEQ